VNGSKAGDKDHVETVGLGLLSRAVRGQMLNPAKQERDGEADDNQHDGERCRPFGQPQRRR